MPVLVLAVGSLIALERDGMVSASGCVADAAQATLDRASAVTATSRVGLDRAGQELLDGLRQRGADLSAMQTDSDYPTSRRIERGSSTRMDAFAAFDNLQWDSDLEAACRGCDAVVTDACGRRHGQARSTIDRVLIASAHAVRAIDLISRPPCGAAHGGDRLEREAVGNAVELCDLFVVDPVALLTLVPSVREPCDAALTFARSRPGSIVALVTADRVHLRGHRTPRPGSAADSDRPEGHPVPVSAEGQTLRSSAIATLLAIGMVQGSRLDDVLATSGPGDQG